jgi:ATP-dependent Lhr-like helicase
MAAGPLAPIEAWFASRGWTPMAFQRRCWQACLAGESGLLQVPTGSGKTYAAVMGPIAAMLAETAETTPASPATTGSAAAPPIGGDGRGRRRATGPDGPEGLRLLVITPLRALSRDLALAIEEPIREMGWPLRVAIRNGDTASHERSRQLRRPPQILITTPESLSVLLSNAAAPQLFAHLQAVVLDEWHELMGSKRGSQCELCLGWLRRLRPGLRTWAISATIGNLEEAARAALGLPEEAALITDEAIGPEAVGPPSSVVSAAAAASGPAPARLITARLRRDTAIRSLLPESIDGFPWGGHLGLRMYEELVAGLDPAVSTLLFTNTRNQAERWHQCLRFACPEMEESLALHHSAIDRGEREAIEARVKSGELRWVVCTSSLDLGVDFQPVERVVQIGSAKNLARLLQRAGRSAHCPGGTSQVLFMPTNALELLEVSAMRRGLDEGLVEHRRPPQLPLDVLLQHLVTLACGPGFDPDRELPAVRRCWSFRQLSDAQWQWCLDFLEHGGRCLGAYPRYRKLVRCRLTADGDLSDEPAVPGEPFRFRVLERSIARLHRFNIGTITADRAVTVRFVRGAVLGHVEEAFIGRLKPGDVFFFAGRQLEFVRLREMTAQVKASTRKTTTVPAWAGGQMALSDLLSAHLRQEVDRCARALAGEAELDTAELNALEPLLRRQADLSRLPRHHQLLLELCHSREGSHLFAFPFEGRFVHEGLGFLWAWRLARHRASTITVSVNDYGFELLAPKGYPFEELLELHGEELLEATTLEADLEQAVNLSELCRRRFRAIAQVSGLITQAMPGQQKSGGQLQISAALLFDVFQKHEPDHLLLEQARREVLDEQLERPRLQAALQRLAGCEWLLERTPRPGPLAFPLLVERLNNRLSNESLLERVQRLIAEAQRAEA